jgi:hypothetical protein
MIGIAPHYDKCEQLCILTTSKSSSASMWACKLKLEEEQSKHASCKSSSASMWACKLKLDEEQSKHASLAQQNSFGGYPSNFPTICWDRYRALQSTQKIVINMIWLVLPVSDWPSIMIDPGGLLLVPSHPFRVLVLVLWVGLEKKKVNN